MPLLFYGRLGSGKRKLYNREMRLIETSAFDSWKIKHLAPRPKVPDLANFWWFTQSNHTAIAWNEGRMDITLPHGIVDNEPGRLREQTIFIPGLLSRIDAVEIMRTEFPSYLAPSPLVFRFNNDLETYLYD